jgi:hypothetical protein
METKKTNPNTELISNFNAKNGAQDKLGKLEDLNLSNDIAYNEKFLYKTISNYFVIYNMSSHNKIIPGASNLFNCTYASQLNDLRNAGADMSNYPKELGEFLN